MSDHSNALLRVGDVFGIGNQFIRKSNLVRSWFNRSWLSFHMGKVWDQEELRQSHNYSASIDEQSMGNISRISLGGLNEGRSTKYLQFEHDASNRVTSVIGYDSKGQKLSTFIQFTYGTDNSLQGFKCESFTQDDRVMDEWVPVYSGGKLIALKGSHDNKNIEVTYQYDNVGRINQISVHMKEDEQVGGYRSSSDDEMRIDRYEERYIAAFVYESNNTFWSNATLTGKKTKTKIRGLTTTPEIESVNLGMVRYEQTLQ
jgi:hypothetical protein